MYKILLSTLLTSSILFSASPNIGDMKRQIMMDQKELQNIRPKKSLIELDGINKVYKAKLKKFPEGKKVLINSFIFTGNKSISNVLLSSLLTKYKAKKLSFNDLEKLSMIITKEYRAQGYFVARAYIPKQKMIDNILEIAIIEGNYGEFELLNKSGNKDSLIHDILNYETKDRVINSNSLERALLIVNDLDGVIVSSANIKPGNAIGTSNFVVTTQDTKVYDGYIITDNYGSKHTGKHRFLLGANYYSPFNYGDKISVTGLLTQGNGLNNFDLAYTVPLYKNGLKGKFNYSQTLYSLAGDFKDLDASGTSDTIGFTLLYPYIKKRMTSLDISLNITNNSLHDKIKSTNFENKKSTNVARLSFEYKENSLDLFGLENSLNIQTTFSYGNLKFDDRAQENLDAVGANTQGTFSKINLNIQTNTYLAQNLSLATNTRMQHSLSNKNLDGSEDFSVGGAYGVKLYPDGELSAENGYYFNIEGKYSLPYIKGLNHSVSLFYDVASVDEAKQSSVTFDKRTLQDIGIKYGAKYKGMFMSLQMAYKIDNENITSESDSNVKALAMFGMSF